MEVLYCRPAMFLGWGMNSTLYLEVNLRTHHHGFLQSSEKDCDETCKCQHDVQDFVSQGQHRQQAVQRRLSCHS